MKREIQNIPVAVTDKGTEKSDSQRIDETAAEILRKYRAAFEELAK